jgi:Uma2 family endonuclease
MKSAIQNIPDELVYEMVKGKPIYYKGYLDVLSGQKQLQEIMGSSYLQSLIITNLVLLLGKFLPNTYRVLTNEIGLQFAKKSWRAADIAIFEKKKLKTSAKENKYIGVPPKIVIEIDTKANIEEVKDTLGYFHLKTDELLDFGVEKVLWIFTDSKKVMIATKEKSWETHNWDKDISILNDIRFNIQQIIDED